MPQRSHINEDFVHLFNQGDERGLAYIFDKLYPLMVYYANERVKDKLLAEDIASTAFVKLWRKHELLDQFATIKAYLLKIVQRDYSRALVYEKKRKETHQLAGKDTIETDSAFHSLVKAETYNNLHQAIKQLSPGMRSVMESLYIEGNSVTETAKILNINTSTVDTQKKRALQKLAKILPQPGFHIIWLICIFW